MSDDNEYYQTSNGDDRGQQMPVADTLLATTGGDATSTGINQPYYSMADAGPQADFYPAIDTNLQIGAYSSSFQANPINMGMGLPLQDAVITDLDLFTRDLRQLESGLSKLDLSSMEVQHAPLRIILLPIAEQLEISANGRPTDKSEGAGNWLLANVKDPEKKTSPTKLFAMSWDDAHVGCRVSHIDGSRFAIYFIPSQDHVILYNTGVFDIFASQVGEGNSGVQYQIKGGMTLGRLPLAPGEWIFYTVYGNLAEAKVLGRAEWAVSHQPAKRHGDCSTNLPKKSRLSADLATDGAIYRTGDVEMKSSGHALLDLNSGQTIHVGFRDSGESTYRLKRLELIADGLKSSIWKGKHSKFPGKVVSVQVLKPKINPGLGEHPCAVAEYWVEQATILASLGDHFGLRNFLGADARFYSIYTEYVDAQPLDQHVTGPADNPQFSGNVQRAWRIINDIAAVLSFLHKQNVVHGDIRPGNILYNPLRGTLLVGFGNGFRSKGTRQEDHPPWYMPPEFLENPESLGAPADMFAFGVVMMWVLHRIRLPESGQYWDVRDVHDSSGVAEDRQRIALRHMQLWMEEIREAALIPSPEGGVLDDAVNALVKDKEVRFDAEKLESWVIKATQTPPPRRRDIPTTSHIE
ncbi:kinase-like domain-containing protein [Nemania sp. FL0031]|nr:kinase-like domain-containing protein [Nemania sp. FL0031]